MCVEPPRRGEHSVEIRYDLLLSHSVSFTWPPGPVLGSGRREGKTLVCINPVGSVTSDRWAQDVLCIYHLGVGRPEKGADTEG